MKSFKEYYSVLLENQNYEGMFTSIFNMLKPQTTDDNEDNLRKSNNIKKEIKDGIKWARTTLKKNDRIVWFLRLLRYSISLEAGVNSSDAIKNFNKKIKTNYTKNELLDVDTYHKIRYLQGQLEHFFSMNIPEINNYVFANQLPVEILSNLSEIEEEYKTKTNDDAGAEEMYKSGRLIKAYNDDDIIIKFPDGYAWVDLNNPTDDDEGKSMGHCGNRASYKSDETILSLRKSIKFEDEKWWYPVCTFILNGDGMLGEMKGRNNDKPQPRYHPYIIALLKNSVINGIKGGGYLPENNFSLDDLGDEKKQELIHIKPQLGDVWDLYKSEGNKITKKVLNRIYHSLSMKKISNDVTYDEEDKQFIVYEWKDFENFIDNVENRDSPVKTILSIALGESEFQFDNSELAFKHVIEELPPHWARTLLDKTEYSNIRNRLDLANRLIDHNDQYYTMFLNIYQNQELVIQNAWERLLQYIKVGWSFSCYGHLNIYNIKSVDELKNFVKSSNMVTLSVSETSMLNIADSNDDYYDCDIDNIIIHGWDSIEDNNYDERRSEYLLDDGKDTWLSGVDSELLVDQYIQLLQHGFITISDDRQISLDLKESLKRLLINSGIMLT